jgi:GntR family transcriptional regulator
MNHLATLPPLDSSHALPLYRQLRDSIQNLLSSGVWQPDTPIPSEREMTESLGISRATVRQAIQELELEGWLVRLQGRGTFPAAQRLEQPLRQITGFSQNMLAIGLEPRSKLISAQLEPATVQVAKAMRLVVGAPVAGITRLRFANDTPLMFERAHFNYALVPSILEQNLENSVYEILTTTYRLKFARGEERIEAVLADTKLAHILGLKSGQAVLYTQRTVQTDDGTCLEYTERFARADQCSFHVVLEGNNSQFQVKKEEA